MPIHKNSLNDVRHLQKKLHCADEEDMKIRGTFQTERASLLEVQLVRCFNSTEYDDRQVTCKSEEEITEFIRGNYIILVYNHRRFNPELYK